jgi:hypothetical protein
MRWLATMIVVTVTLPASARGQGVTAASLNARSLDQLRAERGQVAALLDDLDDGDAYISDPRVGLYGPEDGDYLDLPVPVDKEALTTQVVLALIELGGMPDNDSISRYFRDVQRTTRESQSSLGQILRQYDDAIRRKTGGGQPVDTSDQDALARQAEEMTDEECIRAFGRPCDRTERHFDPNDHESVESYLNTMWRLQVRGAGGAFEGDLRMEYIHCEPADDVIAAVSCDFNGLLYVEGQAPVRVQNGMYIGGEMRMILYLNGANATLEGALSAETGEMAGANVRLVGPAADDLGLPSGGTWRAYR